MTLKNFAPPPDTRTAGQGNPPLDVDNIVDWVDMSIGFSILNTSFAGGAKLDGTSDSTAAVQACMNAAATFGAPVLIPAGVIFRVSQLTWNAGQIIEGVYSGTYPASDSITTASILARLAGTDLDLIVVPDGTNYGRISDVLIDGNKNNNTSGIGFNIEDGAAGQETQIHIERCYFGSNPGSNVYLGNNRRGNKVTFGVFNYSGAGDGITVCGSDNLIMSNICGSNARAGINLGSTISQNWAAFGSNLNSTTTHVFNNDVYQNLVGICVPASVTRSLIVGNGIDRNQYQGITVYNGDANTIAGNALHSNGQAANNTYGHIDLAAGVSGVCISDNVFGPVDGGITNQCSFCVVTEPGIGNGVITGNIGNEDGTAPDTVGGLISTAGSNTSPSVMLSKGGAIIQAANSTQHIFQLRNASGTTVFDMTNAGTFSVTDGAGKFEAGLATGNGHTPQSVTGNGQTITVPTAYCPVTCAASYTGLILAAGAEDGELCTINNLGTGTLTFAAAGTSNVAGGAANVIADSAPGNVSDFIWDASTSLWYAK